MNLSQEIATRGTEARCNNQHGAALIFAISLLALFGFLGSIFVRNMSLHLDEAHVTVDELRARNLATAGIQSAIADLSHAIVNKNTAALLDNTSTYEFPTYTHLVDVTTTDEGLAGRLAPPNDLRTASAEVIITHENEAGAAPHRYRIISESSFVRIVLGRDLPGTHGRVEVIIQFDTNGDYEILYWNTQRSTD